MQRDEVRTGEQFLDRAAVDRAGLGLDFQRGAAARVVEDAHAEAEVRLARGGLGDAAEADQAQGLAGDLRPHHVGRPPAGPFAGAQMPLALAAPPRGGEHQQDRQLGGGVGQHVGRVGHHQAQPARRLQVDVVDADAEVAEHPAGALALFEQGRAQAVGHGRADRVVAAQGLRHRLGRQRRVGGVERHLVLLGQPALGRFRPAAGQQHFRAGHGSPFGDDRGP